MNEHKHGEPWEDIPASKKAIARAVLCVNACAGIPDKELVEYLKQYKEYGPVLLKIPNILKENDTLQTDLADAVGLLEARCRDCTMDRHGCDECKVKVFLTKHNKGV